MVAKTPIKSRGKEKMLKYALRLLRKLSNGGAVDNYLWLK
jgi:hypothetical protein